ncbi:MAG: GNAT family N-acetyltransferase [Spirochaetes bacterium]|nr:GNAT family N-acetyltransferase [Spirochaetota bacterium]
MYKIIIRKATKNDLLSVIELYAQLAVDKEKTLDLSSAGQIFDRIRQYPDYNVYVALMGNDIIGTFALLIIDNLAHSGSKSGLVEDVVVSPEWQNKGVGKQMMDFAIQECRKAKCYKVALSSNLIRESAHKFYESLGFQKHGFSFLIDI